MTVLDYNMTTIMDLRTHQCPITKDPEKPLQKDCHITEAAKTEMHHDIGRYIGIRMQNVH